MDVSRDGDNLKITARSAMDGWSIRKLYTYLNDVKVNKTFTNTGEIILTIPLLKETNGRTSGSDIKLTLDN